MGGGRWLRAVRQPLAASPGRPLGLWATPTRTGRRHPGRLGRDMTAFRSFVQIWVPCSQAGAQERVLTSGDADHSGAEPSSGRARSADERRCTAVSSQSPDPPPGLRGILRSTASAV
ncbi:hypothetical protein NDU88_000234 [Pleurodeles waltl]|uniref:Uncharacterized protein n=1 Tax=Pleurodeles waltl TaxID=8319 RepID=A0AAV7UPE3_PLEWA|nr:hypothetical protein NDU88_000234 [Pleurodeles waltl]